MPEKINVIAAEKSPSLVTGTYVKHPNQKGFYLVSCSLTSSMDGHDAVRSSFSCNEEDGVETLWGYHWLEYQDFETYMSMIYNLVVEFLMERY